MNKLPTIEQRIAAALTAADVTSTDLAGLIAEVEAAAQAADENAAKAREQALDPAVVVDTAKVGAAVADCGTHARPITSCAAPAAHALHGGPRTRRYRRVEGRG